MKIIMKYNGGIRKKIRYSKGSQDSTDQCQDRFSTFCSFLRKLFGGKESNDMEERPPSPPPIKKQLKECLSKLSQQTFSDSDSSSTSDPPATSSKESKTSDSGSFSNRRQRKMTEKPRNPGNNSWVREAPCLRCKAKRTREWLAQHFFEQDWSSHEKSN
ncbi:serine-rich single-pass membrane protein 1 [Rhineura floridana]|uniref:serine-rich single-pass membrane protein 1 n=1 Tax=Rhineura floridana TaxID=261503 RepID=UPI002AC88F30|nr:serine-rich single-pass membrane protein 1 [Rhineura floridana]